MFAVPGWSLPAKVETQKDVPESSGKKRKRKREAKAAIGTSTQEPAAKSPPQVESDTYGRDAHDKSRELPSQRPHEEKSKRHKKRKPDIPNERQSERSAHQQSQANLTPLQAAMAKKLAAARFRHLNETLYTTPSTDASRLFDANPTFFADYHSGFQQQVTTWPENPVDGYIDELRQRSTAPSSPAHPPHVHPLPRTSGTCTVADLGCGAAALAQRLQRHASAHPAANLRVLSYDLAAPNAHVTVADIARLPLRDASVNVAVLCLALMGTNWPAFVDEAWRVLAWRGELWVAEIKSRFARPRRAQRVEHSVGNKKRRPAGAADKAKGADSDDGEREREARRRQLAAEVDGADAGAGAEQTDVSAFVGVLRRRGFSLQQGLRGQDGAVDLRNKMFVKMYFVKDAAPSRGKNASAAAAHGKGRPKFLEASGDELREEDEAGVLKPCLYKVR